VNGDDQVPACSDSILDIGKLLGRAGEEWDPVAVRQTIHTRCWGGCYRVLLETEGAGGGVLAGGLMEFEVEVVV